MDFIHDSQVTYIDVLLRWTGREGKLPAEDPGWRFPWLNGRRYLPGGLKCYSRIFEWERRPWAMLNKGKRGVAWTRQVTDMVTGEEEKTLK